MYLSVISKMEDDIITRFVGNIKNNLSKKQKVVIDTTNYIFNKHVEYSDHCSKVNDVVFIKTHKVGRKTIIFIQSSVTFTDWQQLNTKHILEIWNEE